MFSIFIYLIRKNPSQLLFSCANKSLTSTLHRKSTHRLSSILQQQQSSSLNLSHSRYTPAPNINDLPPSSNWNDCYEPPLYPGPPLFSSSDVNYSDSIYYETIKTPTMSNSMSMLHPMQLPEPQGFTNIRTHCV
jgi:hypothetical protein